MAVSGSTPKMAERFLRAYSLGHLLDDPKFATNEARVTHGLELDDAVMRGHRIPHARGEPEDHRVQSLDCGRRLHGGRHREGSALAGSRQLTLDVPDGDGTVRMHNVVRGFSGTPGEIRLAGGALGQENTRRCIARSLACRWRRDDAPGGRRRDIE